MSRAPGCKKFIEFLIGNKPDNNIVPAFVPNWGNFRRNLKYILEILLSTVNYSNVGKALNNVLDT